MTTASPPPQRVRRWPALVFFTVVAVGVVWLGWQSIRPVTLPVGSPLPEMVIQTVDGPTTLAWQDGDDTLVLIVFKSDCHACEGEFRSISSVLSRIPDHVQLVALSGEIDLSFADLAMKWPRLSAHPGFTWATTDVTRVRDILGARLTPALYVFARFSGLRATYVGQTNIMEIL